MPKLSNFVLIIVAILAILFFIKSCKQNEENKNLLSQISQYKLGEKAFTTKIQSDSSTIATQAQTILTKQQAIELGLLQLDGLKKISSQITATTKTKIEEVEVSYVPDNFADTTGWYKKLLAGDTTKTTLDSLRNNTVIVPKKFTYTDNGIQ